jgi:ferrous iron transport protein B
MMFLITMLSWVFAMLFAKLIRSTILRGPATPFLLELPPYRIPTFKGLLIHTWERTWQYIQKAGSTILAISILFWALMSFPQPPEANVRAFEARRQQLAGVVSGASGRESALETGADAGAISGGRAGDSAGIKAELAAIDREEAREKLRSSAAGRMGIKLEALTRWCGFDWRMNVALMAGFAAKEVIISTLGASYAMGEAGGGETGSLSRKLASDPDLNKLKAFALVVFIMLYSPCVATIACIIKESAWKWGLFSMAFNTTVAFLAAVLIYQAGRCLGLGT